ncbi:glycoside hydrolase family 16 protein [Cucurbitaria berberidis CBS 394.84]|uniref:chitinase n=1 Tax=Cucurbitaria berberidis CBS 394.84 TaxID=1168544 RepID=A0A9P4GU45_9PLEO|nr:glycoside hydrolase family 16 protein [Cucurbitaria berberidis CBS 394.84]KAF1851395.1 glycoside hydrolase family 16 protein [Cucurbitaria berberidis CBS 394.84]
MKSFAPSALALLAAALLPTAFAQTHTNCNPLKEGGTKCPSMQALGGNATFNFNKTGIPTGDKIWTKQNQGKIDWNEKGATFTVERSGDSPTVQSKFYMLFGRFEVIMRAASGRGIVSSAILQSEALDEVDWEFLGSNNTHVMTNFYGKGNTTSSDRGKEYKMDKGPQDEFHNYTIDWTKERIEWWLDGKKLRELLPAQALGGKNYPQTPMNVRMGIWAGGDTKNNKPGVVEWAGGETNFDEGPFVMTVASIYAKDYTSAAEYSWADMDASGSWEKVKVITGKSKILQELESPSGVHNRWQALPQGAKIGIIAAALSVLTVIICLIMFCCVKQRRAGRKEHEALLAEEHKEAAELQEYKKQMQAGKFGFGSSGNRV